MRGKTEIEQRAAQIREDLLLAVAERESGLAPELDLVILSLLDQLEILIWVLEPGEVLPGRIH